MILPETVQKNTTGHFRLDKELTSNRFSCFDFFSGQDIARVFAKKNYPSLASGATE